MSIRFRAIGFAIGVSLMLLSAQTIAKADQFQFTFATDPVGCANFSGGCGAVYAQGTFLTDPLTTGPQFGTDSVFPVESIVGKFDGFNMTIGNPGSSAIVQSSLNLLAFGPGIIFTAGGQEFELEFNQNHPSTSSNLLFNFGDSTFKAVGLTVNPVSVPEPSELSLAGAGLLGLAGLRLFRSKL